MTDSNSIINLTDRQLFVSRRLILVGAPSLIALTGCASGGSGINCDVILSQLDESLCNQKTYFDKTANRITVGAAIGAALGLAVAASMAGNPAVLVLVGAFAGGTIALADSYLELKLKEAKGNSLKRVEIIKSDIVYDKRFVETSIREMTMLVESAVLALRNENNNLKENYEKLKKSVEAREVADNNIKLCYGTADTYTQATSKIGMIKQPGVSEDITAIKSNAATAINKLSEFDKRVLDEGLVK